MFIQIFWIMPGSAYLTSMNNSDIVSPTSTVLDTLSANRKNDGLPTYPSTSSNYTSTRYIIGSLSPVPKSSQPDICYNTTRLISKCSKYDYFLKCIEKLSNDNYPSGCTNELARAGQEVLKLFKIRTVYVLGN